MTFQDTTNMIAAQNTITIPAKKVNWRQDESVADLLASLRFRRPKGGPTETRFIRQFLDAEIEGLQQDEAGNIYKIVGGDDPKVLWSSHTDSVHRMEGEQAVVVDGDWIRLPKSSKSNCLGADDMAGIWVMRRMIKAGVPGMYVFHYGEESGCIGSSWVAKNHPEYLKGIQAAVAFDRRNFHDVITHQMNGRCCSDEFALSLAKLLPDGYKPSPNGVYTDTASYTEIVAECTNVSVGYQNEHSSDERLNIPHLLALSDKLCAITQADIDALVIKRDPKAIDPYEDDWYGYGWYGNSYRRRKTERSEGVYTGKYGNRYQHLGSAYDNDGDVPFDTSETEVGLGRGSEDDRFADYEGSASYRSNHDEMRAAADSFQMPETMEELLESFPRSMGRILEAYGFSVEDLWEEMLRGYANGH